MKTHYRILKGDQYCLHLSDLSNQVCYIMMHVRIKKANHRVNTHCPLCHYINTCRVSLTPVRQCICIVWSKTESCTCTRVHVSESFFKLSPYDPSEQPLHVLYKSFGIQRLHCELPFRSSDVVSAARWYKWRSLIPILHAECSHGRVWGARVQGVTLWLHWRGWSGGVYMGITREVPLTTCAFLGPHSKTNTEVSTCILDGCGQYCLESLDCPCKPDDKNSGRRLREQLIQALSGTHAKTQRFTVWLPHVHIIIVTKSMDLLLPDRLIDEQNLNPTLCIYAYRRSLRMENWCIE